MNLPASSGHPPAVALWWDGGERAITAREKARIEEHSSSSFSIPLVAVREGWALVDLDDNAVVPQYPSSKMLDAGWPRGEFIADTFDVVGAYADLIALASPVSVFHGRGDAQVHADDMAVDAFAAAMKDKLAAARAKGRGGWEDKDQCGQQYLSDLLREHVLKDDPVDVANFCMMLSMRGERILPAKGIVLTHVRVIESLLSVAYAAWNLADDTEDDGDSLTVARADFDALSTALDQLDDLPDDQPGYVMECAAKARWALRGLIDQRDAAPGVSHG